MKQLELIDALFSLKEKKTAIEVLHVLGKHATNYEQLDIVCSYFFKNKLVGECFRYVETLSQLVKNGDPRSDVIMDNILSIYLQCNYPERALEIISIYKNSNKYDMEIYLKEAFAYYLLNDKQRSAKMLVEKLKDKDSLSEKQFNEIMFNLAPQVMVQENFVDGLRQSLSYGNKISLWPSPELPFTPWDGTLLENKTLIIQADGGIGDEIINCRFTKYITEAGMKPYWYTDRKDVREVLSRNGINAIDNLDQFMSYRARDVFYCKGMWLPILLNLEPERLWYGAYLTPNPSIYTPLELETDKFKIGIRWQGSADYEQDLHRSLPLVELIQATESPDTLLVSLQRDTGTEELEGKRVLPLHETSLNTLEQTMAAIEKLDLIVTSCTSVAHLAAAMGKKTIVLVPISAYYTWYTGSNSTPWYGDNVTVLHQESPRCWNKPFIEVRRIVNEQLETRKNA